MTTGSQSARGGESGVDPARVLLLIGSPHASGSASEALGGYLVGRLADAGFHRKTINVVRAGESEAATAKLLAASDRAGVIVLSTPMYVDSLPAAVTGVLETLAAHRRTRDEAAAAFRGDAPDDDPSDAQRFVAIVNIGFPEAAQADTALAICRRFALETGFGWAGGLAMGAGGMAKGKNLAGEEGGRLRNVVRALDLSAEALAKGDPIPARAVELMAKPVVRPRLYRFATNASWRRAARKAGATGHIEDRPFTT